ncbi:MAG: hypothetical protein R6W71_11200, partial [Bacteroidales bacterium]
MYLYTADGVKHMETITDIKMTKIYESCTTTPEGISKLFFNTAESRRRRENMCENQFFAPLRLCGGKKQRTYDTPSPGGAGRHIPDPAGQFASPYLGMGNSPVAAVDLSGLWAVGGRFAEMQMLQQAEQKVRD